MALRAPQTRQRGVTLIELIIVIAVIGILATIAAPNLFRYIQRFRTRRMTQATLTLLQYARERAVTERRFVGVQFQQADPDFSNGESKNYMGVARVLVEPLAQLGQVPLVLEYGMTASADDIDIFNATELTDFSDPPGWLASGNNQYPGVSYQPVEWSPSGPDHGFDSTIVFAPTGMVRNWDDLYGGVSSTTSGHMMELVNVWNKDAPFAEFYSIWIDGGGNTAVTRNGQAPSFEP